MPEAPVRVSEQKAYDTLDPLPPARPSVLETNAHELLPEDNREEQEVVPADTTIPLFTSYHAGLELKPVPLSDPGLPIRRLKQSVKPGTGTMSAEIRSKRRAKRSFSVGKTRPTTQSTRIPFKNKVDYKVLSALSFISLALRTLLKTAGATWSRPKRSKRTGDVARMTQLLQCLLENREKSRRREIFTKKRVARVRSKQLLSPPSSDDQMASHESPEPVPMEMISTKVEEYRKEPHAQSQNSECFITPAGVAKLRTILKMVIHLPGDKTKTRLAKLDTGSKVNLISQDVAEDLPIKMEPYPEDGEGVAPLGEPIRPLGTLTFDWHVMARQKTYTSTFLVLDPVSSRMFDALLGAETIEQIGFYQTNDHIWFTTGTWEKPGL